MKRDFNIIIAGVLMKAKESLDKTQKPKEELPFSNTCHYNLFSAWLNKRDHKQHYMMTRQKDVCSVFKKATNKLVATYDINSSVLKYSADFKIPQVTA